MSRDCIEAWAEHLGMRLSVWRGDVPHILLREPVTLRGSMVYEKLGALGQSVAVLSFV